MAINHTALTEDLGVVFGAIKEANTFRGTTLTARSASFLAELDPAYTETLNAARTAVSRAPAALDGYAADLADVAARIVRDVVDADQLLPSGTADTTAALREWARQFVLDGETFDNSPCTVVLGSGGGNVGDTYWPAYVRDETGADSDFVIPDLLIYTLQSHADNGGTRWAETWRLRSRPVDGSPLDAAYPRGHGLDTSVAAVDPASDGGLLSDPSFDTYASGAFTSWTRIGATTATHSFQTADDARDGASGFCATLKGDGTVVPGLKQTVAVTGASHYAVHLLIKSIARPTATNRVRVSLRKVSDDSVLTDDAGAECEASFALDAAGAWNTSTISGRLTGHFVTPARLPVGGVYLDVRITGAGSAATAPANTTEQRIDFVSLQTLSPLTPRGLLAIGWSGLVEPAADDYYTTTVALAAGTVSANFIRWLDRTMNVSAAEFRFPTSATPSQPDSVIV